MLLLIDNYDSFTYNLFQYLLELGAEVKVIRNDALSATEALALAPSLVVISPGPGRPTQAGMTCEFLRRAPLSLPVLGVCLGHQALGEVFGGEVVLAQKLMHGKTSQVAHDGRGVFDSLPSPLTVMRYHSLTLAEESIPDVFAIVARNDDDGEVMAIRHKTRPLTGVQFHPESIMTEHGKAMLGNFLRQHGGGEHAD